MAHVTDERGQLILVTGLLIAVAMVSLVLLLNTAIYSENLASRGVDQSGREAVEYQATVVEGVSGVLEEENLREHGSQAAVEENVTTAIDLIDNYTARSYATGGTVVRVNESAMTVHEGRLLRQNDPSRQFIDNSDTGLLFWELATGVDGTRDFRMTVDRSSLRTTNDSDALVDGAFRVELSDGIDSWEAFVYENESTNEIAVATTAGASQQERCSVNQASASINWTAGTLAGEPCPGLEWADGVSGSFDVNYHHGQNATGTYDLTVNTSDGGSVTTINFNDGRTNPTSPYWVPAVYSTTFTLTYQSPTLDYRAEVRIAPGESG